MAFRDFFRGDHERDEDERNRDRWRSMGEDWRDERSRGDYYRGSERRYGSGREWSPGSEFTEERAERFGGRSAGYGGRPGYGGRESRESYGQGFSRSGADYDQDNERGYGRGYGDEYQRRYGQGVEGVSGRWRDEDRNFGGDYGNRGAGSGVYGRYYGGGGASGRESGRSYGEGGYGRDEDYGRRGALGYGGYGGVGGAETGSSALNWAERQQEEQHHRGKGPKGFKRSDARIHEDVCECLTEDPRIDASNLEVTVKDCEVTLSGTVSSREEKRRAEDLVERVSGVKDVNNNLRVSADPGAGQSMASPSAKH